MASTWVAVLGLLIGYSAAMLLVRPLSLSGGYMHRCLQYIFLSVTLLSLAFMSGPIILYYQLIGEVVVGYVRYGLLLASLNSAVGGVYYLYAVIAPHLLRARSALFGAVYTLFFIAAIYGVYLLDTTGLSDGVAYIAVGTLLYVCSVLVLSMMVALFIAGRAISRVVWLWGLAVVFMLVAILMYVTATLLSISLGSLSDGMYEVALVLVMTTWLIAAIQLRRLAVYANPSTGA